MPRSSSPLNIFKDPDPTRRPFLFGRLPSTRGGHLVDVSFGVTPEGQMVADRIGDHGPVFLQDDPFSYLALYGSETELTPEDMKELLTGMEEGRQERARKDPAVLPTPQQIRNQAARLIEAVNDAKAGRRHFGFTGEHKSW